MKTYIVTFGNGAKCTVEAESQGAARAVAQDARFPHGVPVYPSTSAEWEESAIVSVEAVKEKRKSGAA